MVAVASGWPQRIGRTLKVTFMVGNGSAAWQLLVSVDGNGGCENGGCMWRGESLEEEFWVGLGNK